MHSEDEHWVIDKKEDFKGWEVLHTEEWKPGIKRVSMKRVNPSGFAEFIIAYCRDEFLRGMQGIIR